MTEKRDVANLANGAGGILRRSVFTVLAAMVIGIAGLAWGGESGADVTLELVSEMTAIRPGEPFTVGLRIVHGPGFHTYWSHPGIVGVPTSLEWELPKGFSAGPIRWPQPKVVKMGVVNAYGYEDEAFLLVKITPPPEMTEKEIRLRARAVYMACATTCHPGFEDVELALPVALAGSAEPAPDARWREGFKAARASFPGKLSGWACSVERVGERFLLRLEPDSKTATPNRDVRQAYFFSTDSQVNSDAPQIVRRLPSGGILLELERSFYAPENPKDFRGILYSAQGWLESEPVKAMRVHVPWPATGGGDP